MNLLRLLNPGTDRTQVPFIICGQFTEVQGELLGDFRVRIGEDVRIH